MPVDPPDAQKLSDEEIKEQIALLTNKRRSLSKQIWELESDIITLKEVLRRRTPEKCFP